MLTEDAVRVIADQLSSTDNDIVKATLKTLVSYCSSIEGAVQVQRSCSGAGFEQLVKLAQTGSKPELALLCISNLAHVASCRPDLGKAGAISVIFQELKKPIYKSEPRTLITALSLFCSEIVNRVRIRDNNHLPDLLDLYKSERYSYLQDIVSAGLTKYTYDDISLKVMIDHGLVSVLIAKLRQHIHSLYPTKHNSTSLEMPDYGRRLSLDSESDTEKSPSWQLNLSPVHCSPRRSPIPFPVSPSTSSHGMSSPPASPLAASCWSPAYSTCSGQTETYSPVYEDSSDDDNCDGLLETDEQSDIPKEEEDRHSYKINIFILLHRISALEWAVPELMIPSVVNTLLAYLVIGRLYISRVAIILAKIMSKHQFLLPLVHQRFAILVFTKLNLRRHEDCSACSVHESIGKGLLDKAASVAEGPYGEGELAYLLQKGKEKDIHSTALTIPFVVRTCWLLKKLLLTHKGLPVITSLVTNDEESSCAILTLSRLAKNLRISYSPPSGSKVELFPDYQPGEVTSKVNFLLDDGSEVTADRTALGEASVVFHSMLQGGFKEAKEDVIKLQDISKETLILLLIYCKSYVDTNELVVGTPNVKYVLELFIVSDKFLITDLNSKLLDYTKHIYFNVEHFVSLYKWCNNSLDSTITEVITLYEDACAYLLVGAMKHKTRVQVFNSIIREGMWERMQTCLSTLLSQRMEQGDFE
ncbi:hypothetical protein B566_EDAN004566 [Ephemera danica]|nr:hypothetical protein B566_EDAN004566 [Ephemera danica]